MKKSVKLGIKLIAVLLVIAMLAVAAVSCGLPGAVEDMQQNGGTSGHPPAGGGGGSTGSGGSTGGGSSEGGAEDIGGGMVEGSDSVDDVLNAGMTAISMDYNDYIGDMEAFTYGLMVKQLELSYHVFAAYVVLSTSETVYGLGYTDFSEAYEDPEAEENYLLCGFMPFPGEPEVSAEDFDSGLLMVNMENEGEEEFLLVWSYRSDPTKDHCVIFGNYLQYGVDEQGCIFYESVPYVRGQCDENIGSLYSYDESRFVLDLDLGTYVPITGLSVSDYIDFDTLQEDVERILAEQDFNSYQVDMETAVYFAQETVESFLLGLQQETFLGVDMELLIEACRELDPLTCLRVTPEGVTIVEIEETPPPTPSALAKWLVGGSCALVAAAGIVGSVVLAPYPPLTAVAGGLSGAAIEIFMQVVISNTIPENIKWSSVGVAAASGVLSGLLGPYMQAIGNPVARFFLDTGFDGVIGGLERMILGAMNGEVGMDLLKNFGVGMAMGLVMSGAIKAIGAGASALANKVANSKFAKNIVEVVTKKTSNMKPVKNAANVIKKGIDSLYKKLDDTPVIGMSAKWVRNQQLRNSLLKLPKEAQENMLKSSVDRFTKNHTVTNALGEVLDKKQLTAIAKTAKNGTKLGEVLINGEIVDVVKDNGIVSILFPKKYLRIEMSGVMSTKRSDNFMDVCEILRDMAQKDPSVLPDDVAEAFVKRVMGADTVLDEKALKECLSSPQNTRKLKEAITKDSSWVLHECADMKSIQLVPRELHDKVNGYNGIAHSGGVSALRIAKRNIGSIYFEQLVAAAAAAASAAGARQAA